MAKKTTSQERRSKKLKRLMQAQDKQLVARGYKTHPTDTPGVRTLINPEPDMLHRYFNRGHITDRQFDAATELYELWYKSGRGASTVARYDFDMPRGGRGQVEEMQANSEIRFRRMLERLGPHLISIVNAVVLNDESAAAWAKNNGRKPDDGIAVLRHALEALADIRGSAKYA